MENNSIQRINERLQELGEIFSSGIESGVIEAEKWRETRMTVKEYQELAMRTNDGKCTERLVNTVCVTSDCMIINIGELINASLGLSGEVGELNDIIKKFIFHGHDLNKVEVKKELGDILWYVVMMCCAFGFELEDIMEQNIEKLKKRYPEGFDTQRSICREEGNE